MKKSFKNLPKIIFISVICVVVLACVFLVGKYNTQNPITQTLNIARNMLSSGDNYCVTIADGENILSETLIYGNKKTEQYKIQKENFNNHDVEYPFAMVIDKDKTEINYSQVEFCHVRSVYPYISTKAYSNDAFIDIRSERGAYLISKPTEKQLLMLDSVNNIVSGFVNKEDVTESVFNLLYASDVFKPEAATNDALADTFRAGADDLKSWVKNDALKELEYKKETIPGGYTVSIDVSKEIQLKAASFFKPLYCYIDMHGGDDLNEEFIRYSLINFSIQITVVDKKITQIQFNDLDTSNTITITISEHEDFEPSLINYKSYVTEMDLKNSETIYGYEKDVETRIIENAKLVSDSDICDVSFLTLYESKVSFVPLYGPNVGSKIVALISVKNKTDERIQFFANNVAYNNELHSDIESTCSEYNNTYYLNLVVPEEYCKNDEVVINFDLVCNYTDSEESVTIPISFTANTKIEKDV